VPASFVYDGLGRRQRKTISGTITDFIYDGLNPIREAVAANTVDLLTSLSVDEYLMRVDSAGTRTVLTDALGSTLSLADSGGAIQTEYSYDPFGTVAVNGTSSGNELRYTGREDDTTGLYYYRARYYHPGLQRFISEDPVGFAGGDTNLYAYVWGNPTNLVDPLGFWGFGFTGGGSVIAGLSPLGGGAAAAAGGYGMFWGGCKGPNIGAFASGALAVAMPGEVGPKANILLGGFGGLGGGAFLTNVTNAAELEDIGPTLSLDIGFGVGKFSLQGSQSNGKWIAALTFGPSIGLAASQMQTTTVADPSSRTPCPRSFHGSRTADASSPWSSSGASSSSC
jgi:RHS repeat-associated protein